MECTIVSVPTERVNDWDSFHDVFKELLGFPDFYGRNMNAWIDCMTSVDHAEHGMSTTTVNKGELLILNIEDAADFQKRCPEQYEALLECTAFVNYRRTNKRHHPEGPVLALLLSGHFKRV